VAEWGVVPSCGAPASRERSEGMGAELILRA
jgi:hypothetical protein